MAPIKRWLKARDQELLLLIGLTLIGFIARWVLAVGYALGDDISYTDLIRECLDGHFMQVEPVGQYAFRPMWVYPLAASVKLFGWDRHILALYPLVTGSLIPILTALWVRRHLPPGSKAPLLCAVILVCYPTMFVDSLMLTNELPMIFWALVCVNFFGLAYAQLAQATPLASRWGRLGGYALLTGLTFCAAYQVKSSAVPMLGLCLVGDILLQFRRYGWPKLASFAYAAGLFLLPVIGVQAFYYTKTGHVLGNFTGELRMYDLWLPKEYFQGQLEISGLLWEYVRDLFLPFGYDGFTVFLHGIWVWILLGLAAVAALGWKKLPAEHRAAAAMFVVVSIGLFLFFEFWPARMKPYYIPNCFSGRMWRYLDVLAPSIAAGIAILLTLPGIYEHRLLQWLRVGVVATAFGVAGYSIAVRYYEFEDRASEFRRAGEDQAILKPYLQVPHFIDVDGHGQLRTVLGMPLRPELHARGSGPETIVYDFRRYTGACVWTGGARRYGANADDAVTPRQIQVVGGELRLVHTWSAPIRPWRITPLQLWAFYPAPKTIHDHPIHK